MKKTVVIIEDEMIIAENLTRILSNFDYEVIAVIGSFEEAKEAIKTLTPFVFLIDINLNSPLGNGIDIAKQIKFYSNAKHIYVTANADSSTLAEASSSFPDGYITKPFRANQIYSTLEIIRKISKPVNTLKVKVKGKTVTVEENQIHFIKSDGVYVEIFLEYNKYVHRSSFGTLSETFPSLIRVHKSYLINKNKILAFNSKSVELVCGTEIPVGRSFRKSLNSI